MLAEFEFKVEADGDHLVLHQCKVLQSQTLTLFAHFKIFVWLPPDNATLCAATTVEHWNICSCHTEV